MPLSDELVDDISDFLSRCQAQSGGFGGTKLSLLVLYMCVYTQTGCLGQPSVSCFLRCPDFRGCNVPKQGVWDSQICPCEVSLFQRVVYN